MTKEFHFHQENEYNRDKIATLEKVCQEIYVNCCNLWYHC